MLAVAHVPGGKGPAVLHGGILSSPFGPAPYITTVFGWPRAGGDVEKGDVASLPDVANRVPNILTSLAALL